MQFNYIERWNNYRSWIVKGKDRVRNRRLRRKSRVRLSKALEIQKRDTRECTAGKIVRTVDRMDGCNVKFEGKLS
ncbi:hypothetical protein ACROYT_G021890 [Oculina patagonica]